MLVQIYGATSTEAVNKIGVLGITGSKLSSLEVEYGRIATNRSCHVLLCKTLRGFNICQYMYYYLIQRGPPKFTCYSLSSWIRQLSLSWIPKVCTKFSLLSALKRSFARYVTWRICSYLRKWLLKVILIGLCPCPMSHVLGNERDVGFAHGKR